MFHKQSKGNNESKEHGSDTGAEGVNDAELTTSNGKDNIAPIDSDRIENLKDSDGLQDELADEKRKGDPDLPPLEPVESRSSQLPLSKARTIALVVTLTGAAFLNTLSVQASIIILPTIGRELDIPSAGQQWIVSSYSLAFGCFLLLWGRLADVYGKRLIFILGSAWFSIMTLICPFVPNEIGFDVFRGLQGLGAAANTPTAIGILGVTFPPGKAKNYAFATYSSGAPLGSIFGSIFGGIVGQYAGWKWVFWILAMLAALVTIAGHFLIPLPVLHPSESELKNAVDWIGGTIVTVALFILLFALTEGNIVGWSRPYIGTIIAVSAVLLSVFVVWQLYLERKTTRRPLIKMSLFSNSRVVAAQLTMALFFTSFFNYLVFATFWFQDYKGLDKIQTMLRFLPTGPAGVLASIVVSQLLSRVRVYYIVMFGIVCCTTSSLLFAVPIDPDTTYWAFGFPAMVLCVFGADTVFPSLVLFNAQSLPKEDQALGGALINAVGQVGRAIGLAIAIAIQVAVQESHQPTDAATVLGESNLFSLPYLKGLRAAFWFNVSLALIAAAVVLVGFRGAGIMK